MAEKKIGKNTYRVDKLPATQSVGLMFRLGAVAGPSLGQLGAIVKKDKTSKDDGADRGAVLGALGKVFETADPAKAQGLLLELCECAQVQQPQGNYESVIFDAAFDGNVMDAFKVAAFVVQVNFGDFFAGKPPGA